MVIFIASYLTFVMSPFLSCLASGYLAPFFWGLGLCEASCVPLAALIFLGSCLSSQDLCTHFAIPVTRFYYLLPGKDLAIAYWTPLSGGPFLLLNIHLVLSALSNVLWTFIIYSSLLNSVPSHDQAKIWGICPHSCASASLQAIPSELSGLTLSGWASEKRKKYLFGRRYC